MNKNDFLYQDSKIESFWRGLILFGQNSASYKFAFAKSLLELKAESGKALKLHEIAPYYSKHLIEHLKNTPKQTTSKSSTFISALLQNGIESINENKVLEETVKRGFVNVVDAFQNIGQTKIPIDFYHYDKRNKQIVMTDEFSKLLQSNQLENLYSEVESRWNLVEHAWSLGITTNVIAVTHDVDENLLFTFDQKIGRRKNITSSRGALNGYQKGFCFYCSTKMNVEDGNETHVDHFIPFKLKKILGETVNGVWNLVLSCKSCNSVSNKGSRLPVRKFLSDLNKRNEYLISSHHPLRETLMIHTGDSQQKRKEFLNDIYTKAEPFSGIPWIPEKKY
jgi:hypothetical protein